MRLKIGQSTNGAPIYLNGDPNHHMNILGMSGSGKTTFLKDFILALQEVLARRIIFDFTGDYLELEQLADTIDVKVLDVRDPALSLSILEPEHPDDTPEDIADRLVGLLQGRMKLGDTQWAYLSELIASGLEQGTIRTFDDIVALAEKEEVHKNVAVRLLPKLQKLNRILPKGTDPATWDLDTPGITILDLHRISDPASLSILVELLVGTICGCRMNRRPADAPPVFLFIDEAHRLKLRENSYIGRLIREGRKFNLHGVFSTQWIKTAEEASMLEQAATQIYFRMSDREATRAVAGFAFSDRQMRERYRTLLTTMPRGQFLVRHNNRFYLSKAPRITRHNN